MSKITYQIGGSLAPDVQSYVLRQADRDLYQALLAGQFCYVFNARQMGKSSLRVRVQQKLLHLGYRCVYLDMTQLGSEGVILEQWYRGIMLDLVRNLGLLGQVDLKTLWQTYADFPIVQQLRLLLDEILRQMPETHLFILVDEIDSILGLDFSVNDFFALIRACHELRSDQPHYQRLTWGLFGVATPSDLISDRQRTPFNIGRAIDLQDFQVEEAYPLMAGFEDQMPNPKAILKAILDWTGGQPLLTQKLCQLVAQKSEAAQAVTLSLPPGTEVSWVEELVQTHIIDYWETQDNPEHLRTIRNRLLYDEQRVGQILSLYQRILDHGGIALDGSPEQIELWLSGLVCQRHNQLQVKNPIYQHIFSLDWVQEQLNRLRPYSVALQAWIASNGTDNSRLLRGEALQDALRWAKPKRLSDQDYRFLAASQELDRQEAIAKLETARLQEVEARLSLEQQRSAEQQRNLRRQRILLAGVSLLTVVATGLGFFAQIRSRQASLNAVQLSIRTSEALFASDQPFEAMLEGIRTQRRLQELGRVNPALQTQADAILEHIVLNTQQYNQLDEHPAAVNRAVFSPDGQAIASGALDTNVKLWTPEGELLGTLEGHQGAIYDVEFSPDGKWLASTGDEGIVKLWTVTGELRHTLETSIKGIWDVDFSPDSQSLIVGGNGPAEVWSITGQRIHRIETGEKLSTIRSIAYHPHGDRLAFGGNDGSITLWTVDGQRLQTLRGHQGAVLALAFSPDGTELISGSYDNTIKRWNSDGQLVTTLDHHTAGVASLAFHPSRDEFVSASHDNTLARWSRQGDLLETFVGHQALVWSVAFSPDGNTLISAGGDSTLRLWQPRNPFKQNVQGLPTGYYYKLIYIQDGKTVAMINTDKNILLVSLEDFTHQQVDAGQGSTINLAHHSTRNEFLSVGQDGTLKRWDMAGNLLQTLGFYSQALQAVTWHPNGQEVVSAASDGQIFRWSAEGQLLQQWQGESVSIWDMAYSPTGEQFATAADGDGTVRLWSREGQLLHTLSHDAVVWQVTYNADGTLLASSSADGTAKIWRSQDGTLVATLQGHEKGVFGIDFSPDRPLIATSGVDKTVRLWNLEGKLLKTLITTNSAVRTLAFRQDGQQLAAIGDDGTLVLWDVSAVLNLKPLDYACDWVQEYLKTNSEVSQSDRKLCDGAKPLR
ncbi:AAA-like domain-containing protein [Dapis sp. BLCC M126]|uniref:AAA-like domain-containing protein n=1 Tax=Dapis sp. BLCC M126 TaxID=3400189 RepID=UPI003CEEAA12